MEKVYASFICKTCGGKFHLRDNPLAHLEDGNFYCSRHVFPALIEIEYEKLMTPGFESVKREFYRRYTRG